MRVNKKNFSDDEILIFDEALVSLRKGIWQFRMWLSGEKKYVRVSLQTTNREVAVERAKQKYHEIKAAQGAGKKYYSLTTKQGVELYLQQREQDVKAGLIVKGRLQTIRTHLKHWLDFIDRDTKLRELRRTDCENYYATRTKTKKRINVSGVTVLNEQASINAMLSWLYKRGEANIEAFDFKKLKKLDVAAAVVKRTVFEEAELKKLASILSTFAYDAESVAGDVNAIKKYIASIYHLVSMMTGLRKGEQMQLTWRDVALIERNIAGHDEDDAVQLAKIRVRAETSKVGKTRLFIVEDSFGYFAELKDFQFKRWHATQGDKKHFEDTLIFSFDFASPLTKRNIDYWFYQAVDAAEIENAAIREIVPYCLRHTFITQLVNKGLNVATVAEMCGTSITQIERTYYHTTEQKMMVNAMPGYDYVDGVLVLKR